MDCSPSSLRLEGTTVFRSRADQIDNLRNARGEHCETDQDEEHYECSAKGRSAVDVTVANLVFRDFV